MLIERTRGNGDGDGNNRIRIESGIVVIRRFGNQNKDSNPLELSRLLQLQLKPQEPPPPVAEQALGPC